MVSVGYITCTLDNVECNFILRARRGKARYEASIVMSLAFRSLYFILLILFKKENKNDEFILG